jgi:hypothetical protein
MASNSSSIVISFSIAILLLLILLLLLSYNSKNKRDNKEQFNDFTSSLTQGMATPYKDFTDIMNQYTSSKERKDEGFENTSVANFDPYAKTMEENTNGIQPNDEHSCNYTNLNGQQDDVKYTKISEGFETQMTEPTSCIKKEKLTSQDLLPKDAQSLVWSKMNPSSQANIEDQNFLTAGYHIGVNTVGQSLRNANLQLRSEIPNPQVAVSPWMISTIEPDIRASSFEIGSAPSY